ncbi:MAG: KOW domain-containing RNA-binding protein [Bacillota bacterium]
MVDGPCLGQLVSSRAGRDRGKCMIVVGIADERTVLVADGDLRKAERPKRKSLRHLVLHHQVAEAIGGRLAEGRRVRDAELRAALGELAPGPTAGPRGGEDHG